MLSNIQALRALAALLVVFVHLETLGRPLGLEKGLFDLFAVGVDLFFVISGFIMVHSTSRRTISPGHFIRDRLLRIVPLYWALTFCVFAVALAWPAMLGTTQADWGALLRSLAFIPYERFDGTIRPILFVGWSLNLEMAFYLLFAITLHVRDAGRRILCGVCMLILAVMLGALFGKSLPPEMRFLTQPILLEFAAGMLLGWVHPRLPTSRTSARLAVPCGASALIALIWTTGWPLAAGWPTALPGACAVVLAALVAERGGLTINWRPVQLTGAASYALYLTHPFVSQAWIIAARRFDVLQPSTAPLLMTTAIVCAVVVAVTVHRRIELPLHRQAGSWIKSLKSSRKGTPGVQQVETIR